MVIRELITKWGFKVDDKPLNDLEKNLDNLKGTLKVVGGAAIAASATMFGFAKSAASAGDNIAKQADKIGISTDALQEYRFAAERSGVGAATMDSALTRLNKRLGDAKNGVGTAVTGFKQLSSALGKPVKFTGDLDNQFLQLVDSLKQVPDEAQRVSIAEQFLGEQGRQLANVVNLGADGIKSLREEAQSLGGVLDEDTARAAEKFTDQMFDLEFVITGVKNLIGAALFPVLGDVIDQFKDFVKTNQQLIKTNITKFFGTLVGFVKNFVSVIKSAFNFLDNLVSLFGGWERAIKFVSIAMIGLLGAQMLIALGSMTKAVFAAIKGFSLLGNAGLLANLKLIAVPLLIGAGIAALALAIEDIIAFFRGDESVTGIIVDEFTQMFNMLDEKFSSFGKTAQFIIVSLLQPIRAVITSVRAISGALGALAGGGGVSGAFGAIKDGFGDFLQPFKEIASGEGASIGSTLGFGASGTPTTQSNITGGNTKVENKIEVNVPEGLTPEQSAKATQSGVKDAMAGLLRETSRAVNTPIEE